MMATLIEQKIPIRVITQTPHFNIYAVQGDSGRYLRCEIQDWTPPDDSTAKILIRKDSGEETEGECTVDGSDIVAELTEEMLSEAGRSMAMVEITSNGETVTAFSFGIIIKRKIGSE